MSDTSKKKAVSSVQDFLVEEEEEMDSDHNDDNVDTDKMIKVC